MSEQSSGQGKPRGNIIIAVLVMLIPQPGRASEEERAHFFEAEVRPLLAENCHKCHGETKQHGGLRLDSREAAEKGGDSGPAIVPGDPGKSLLIQAIRHEDGLEMPPKSKLTDPQIALLANWVESGAFWPQLPAASPKTSAADHWAFQPLQQAEPPEVAHPEGIRNPIDAFLRKRLEQEELAPSPEADRRTLLRRLSYALTGLPPSEADVQEFVNDSDPQVYERRVERYLNSPQYGEQWARHWLDVARYADTKGYVYAREERFWIHAWAYRDWVVKALNEDMPYDRFLMLQLAADQVDDRRPHDLAAMGFLTLGRRFLGVERDIIDDRIDVVTRGTMGLTVACARCHDHKYDPIPTADYYSLYGVFDSCAEKIERLPSEKPMDEAYEKELAARQEKLRTTLQTRRSETGARVRERVGEYLAAQFRMQDFPEEGFDQIIQQTDLIPAFVRRWQATLREAGRRADPVFIPWHAYAAISPESFAQEATAVTETLHRGSSADTNPLILQAFTTPPESMAQVCERYGAVLREVDAQWQSAIQKAAAENTAPPEALEDASAEEIRRVLYGPGAPCEVPDEPIVHVEYDMDSGACNEVWGLRGEVDRWIINSPVAEEYAVTLVDRDVPVTPRIFRRGNPANKGDEVSRHFLTALSEGDPAPFQTGSGRFELAQAITDPANPLTARVIVNRLWAHHFGEGLVTTPSDFGTRAAPPSHPELLDWLALRLIDSGWRLKEIQRLIVLSAAFRQSSTGPANEEMRARAEQIDPANRLVWRKSPHRLTFEEYRDSLLATAGDLDLAQGGKPVNMLASPFPKRRSLYGLVDRQFLPGTLRIFDFANPDLHIPERSETTVPQQALFVMNNPLMLERVQSLAVRAGIDVPIDEGVRRLFEAAFQRPPTPGQLAAARQLVESVPEPETPVISGTAADWSYGYGAYDAASQRVSEFHPLPHFTGSAWQGGASFPDTALGWVQLTAAGGHPGNDLQHAAIRRWTAPRKLEIAIRSKLTHEPTVGDGIHSQIVSSRQGLLQSSKVHAQQSEWSVNSLTVESGETLDFIVDIADQLNTDQYLWTVELTAGETVWNSQKDFSEKLVRQLTGWEQLAQVLFSSNEFMFVD